MRGQRIIESAGSGRIEVRPRRRRQEDVADLMGISQSRVSKIERGHLRHTELGTLESYVQALGGRLRVVAEFGDRSLTLGQCWAPLIPR